jgi:hypothetical protein
MSVDSLTTTTRHRPLFWSPARPFRDPACAAPRRTDTRCAHRKTRSPGWRRAGRARIGTSWTPRLAPAMAASTGSSTPRRAARWRNRRTCWIRSRDRNVGAVTPPASAVVLAARRALGVLAGYAPDGQSGQTPPRVSLWLGAPAESRWSTADQMVIVNRPGSWVPDASETQAYITLESIHSDIVTDYGLRSSHQDSRRPHCRMDRGVENATSWWRNYRSPPGLHHHRCHRCPRPNSRSTA